MKQYIAVVSHDAGKITKYQDFDDKGSADGHINMFGGKVVTGIDDDLAYWDVSGDAPVKDTATQASDKVTSDVLAEISRLEATITPRRIREALTDNSWVLAQEALIQAQRDLL